MEIFNVNRQAYQHLGVMTWASLPDMNTVPAGTRVTIIGWMAPPSDWVWDGAYLLPVGGRAVVHAPLLVDAQATGASSLTHVASVPGWSLPVNMADTPRLGIEVWARCFIINPSNAQARQIFVGTDEVPNAVATHQYTTISTGHRIWGEVTRDSESSWMTFANNAQPAAPGTSQSAATTANMLSSPIRIYYRGGNTDGSETLTINNFTIAVGVG